MTRYNLIKFEKGKYGVRRGWFPFFYEYHDFEAAWNTCWWERDSYAFSRGVCKTTYENAMCVYTSLVEKEEVIL